MAKNKSVIAFLVILILILIVIIGIQSISRVTRPTKIILPSDTIKVSECVPNMGEHWTNPANLPTGPIYLVDNGKVVGVEYGIDEEGLEKNIVVIAGERVGKPFIIPTQSLKFDHIELNYMPEGHEGEEEPHYDIHMYIISQEEQQKLCK